MQVAAVAGSGQAAGKKRSRRTHQELWTGSEATGANRNIISRRLFCVHRAKVPVNDSSSYPNLSGVQERTIVDRCIASVGFVLCVVVPGSPLVAQDQYPSKPIHWIVPSGTGSFDTLTRALAAPMSAALGQPIVVENRPAAGGVLGMELAARALPDGHTLASTGLGQMVVQKFARTRLPYDVDRDFAPISLFARVPMALFVHESVPVASLGELLAYARSNPGKLNYGSSGPGTVFHLTAELLKQHTGTDLLHIPYKGTGPMVQDLIAGRVQVAFYSPNSQLMGFVKAGKLRALALATSERMSSIPEVPTFEQAGVPNFDVAGWLAAIAPAATPRAIVERLQREIAKAVATPNVADVYVKSSIVAAATSPDEFARTIRRDQDIWGPVIRRLGIRED
jgi:tripartite-type tricarboxylate transporter receptor subunit TctC